MTFEQRKQRVIKEIAAIKSEDLLAQLEGIMGSEEDSFESELAEILNLSAKSRHLTPHISAKKLIR